eukprot:RCo009804
MDVLNRMPAFNLDTLMNFSNLSAKAQAHLVRVYQTLALMLALAAAGVFLELQLLIPPMWCLLGTLGFILWLSFTPYDPFDNQQQNKRLAILAGVAIFKGATIAPLVDIALAVDPSLVLVAFVGTAAIFGCFSVAAISAKRRSYLFLGGMLSSALLVLSLLGLANLFLRMESALTLQLYGGLLVFCGYVIYDTQLIIEKASTVAHPDYIGHSLELFMDLVAIFVRILIILLQNAGKGEKKKDSSNRNR